MLRNNRISCIHNNSFTGLYNVRLLSLYDNQLTTISPGAFDTLQTLSTLYVRTQFSLYFALKPKFGFLVLGLEVHTKPTKYFFAPVISLCVFGRFQQFRELVSNFSSSSSGATELVLISMKQALTLTLSILTCNFIWYFSVPVAGTCWPTPLTVTAG